ncbi:MAG: ribonuclease [Betaproteobacteria bacterium]|nr:ribonuclease [Betaproteobacteria bacterium]
MLFRAFVLICAALAALSSPDAWEGADGFGVIRVAELPREAQATLRLIEAGGPFPYARDGVLFQNRERLLPPKPRNYYREYTVPTPGVAHRGARRIVAGQRTEYYYTQDHYRSFRRIIQ